MGPGAAGLLSSRRRAPRGGGFVSFSPRSSALCSRPLGAPQDCGGTRPPSPGGGRQGEEGEGEEDDDDDEEEARQAHAAPASGRAGPSPAERGAQLAGSGAGSRALIYTGSSGAALPTSHVGRTPAAGDGL